ncbi:MAG TPA: hypothetical protein VGE01_14095 [Fimbriimonas sp.]
MAGFECATGYNRHRQWIDQICATHHDRRIMEDYTALYSLGILVAREGVRWPLIDKGGTYDFSSLDPFLTRARYVGMQLIFDLFHYGYPEDLDPMTPEFVERFAAYCHAVATHVRKNMDGPFFFTPVNEPSYLAWAGGDACLFAPHLCGESFSLKVNLIRAAIAGINAIRDVIPNARMVNVDPLCRVATPTDHPELEDEVRYFNENVVYEGWDMLAGRFMPELGGSPQHLDIIGANYYWTNQWEHGRPGSIVDEDDPRWVPLSRLLADLHTRYRQEIVLTETAHRDEHRGRHLEWVADEVEEALNNGVPIQGICIYPVLGMPEWHEPGTWTRMGLWDVAEDGNRFLHEPSARALRYGQRNLENLAIPKELQFENPFLG